MKYKIDREESYSFATITQKKSDTVAAYITIDVHNEHTVKDQAVHLMYGDALLSGAGNMNREQFLSAVNSLGASISVSLAQGSLTISLKSTKAKFGALVKLTETMLNEPLFSKDELKRNKTTVVNELHEAKENSKEIAHAELRNILYGQNDRRYTYDIDETINTIGAINTSHLRALHKRVLSQTWTCSVAGEQSSISTLVKSVKNLK
ncbi:MAG: insulinase family protein, partial [Candidatus Pacebacteria bacterium]|nr:insulinase family protein [Candidatus Paceibacterota bacterium]